MNEQIILYTIFLACCALIAMAVFLLLKKPDKKIEEMTKIPFKNCLRYKQFLQENVYNGKQLIVSGKGGTRSDFSKEDLVKIVTFLLNTQKDSEEV